MRTRTERAHRTSLGRASFRAQIGTYALAAIEARNAGSGGLGVFIGGCHVRRDEERFLHRLQK